MFRKMTVAIATVALSATALSAQAADFSVAIAQTQELDPVATVLKVTVNNIPEGKGVYLQVCENTTTPGESCSTARSGAGASAWLTTAPSSVRMGAMLVSSSATVDFNFPASFTNAAGTLVDCTTDVDKCGVYTRGDHLNSTDLTLKSFTAISFAGASPKVGAILGAANGRVAVRVFGAEGKTVVVKIGGRWVSREIASNNELVTWRSSAKSADVRVFVAKQELAKARVNLR